MMKPNKDSYWFMMKCLNVTVFFTNEIPQNGTLRPLGRKMRRFASRIDFVASTQLFFVWLPRFMFP